MLAAQGGQAHFKARKVLIQYFQRSPQLAGVLGVVLAELLLGAPAGRVVAGLLTQTLEALAIHHQQVHHKVVLAAQALLLVANMVLVAVAVLLLLALMEQHQ